MFALRLLGLPSVHIIRVVDNHIAVFTLETLLTAAPVTAAGRVVPLVHVVLAMAARVQELMGGGGRRRHRGHIVEVSRTLTALGRAGMIGGRDVAIPCLVRPFNVQVLHSATGIVQLVS